MKNLLMMLSVLALLGCKALDSTVSANPEGPVGAEVIPATVTTTANATTPLTNPLWRIRSEQSAARSQDYSAKIQSRTAKPQGPFTVRYVLENWALDDHRLVVEVQSNQSISDWQVDLPQVIEKQERATRLAKPNIAERGAPEARTFSFGALPEANRLVFTVSAVVSGITASKTVSIPLRSSANPSAKACDRTEVDCVRLLPAKTIY